MDLLGTILDSMDRPPTASEKEREEAKSLFTILNFAA